MRNYKIHVLFGESTTMMSWIFKLDPALIMTWGNYINAGSSLKIQDIMVVDSPKST
jgi:hypothetical protein